MQRARAFCGLGLTILLVGSAWAQSESAKQVDPASWAPSDALVFVGVSDVDAAWKALENTSSFKLMKDPVAKEVMKGAGLYGTAIEKFKERLAKVLDVQAEQLKSPFAGAIAFYVATPASGKLDDALPGLVAGIGDKSLAQQYYTSAVKRMRDQATKYEQEAFGGQNIDVFVTEPKPEGADDSSEGEKSEEKKDPNSGGDPMSAMLEKGLDEMFSPEAMPPKLATCLTEDRLIVGADADSVKRVLRQEADGTLAGADDYKSMGRHFDPLGRVRFFVNITKLVELSAKGEDAADVRKQQQAMGVDSMRALIGHIYLGDDAFESKAELMLLMSGDRTGLAKIFSMKNTDVAPPKNLPTDAVGFISVNLNFSELLDEIEKIMRQEDPDMADQMRAGLEAVPTPEGEKYNLRKEVIENLQPPLAVGLAFTRPYGIDSLRMLLTLGHRNKAAMEKALTLVPMLVPREVRGTQVYDMGMFGFSFAPTNDAVLIGVTPAVEAALQSSGGEAFAAEAAFRKAAQHTPKEAWLTGFFDSRRFMEALFALSAKSEELQAASMQMNIPAGMVSGMLQAMQLEIKPDKAEEARKLLRYYAPAIVTISTTPDGIRFTQVQLKPEAE